MIRLSRSAFAFLVFGSSALACSSSSGTTPGPDGGTTPADAGTTLDGAPPPSPDCKSQSIAPQAPTSPGSAYDDTLGHHQVAANGKRVYAVQATVDKSGAQPVYSLTVTRSDDAGATWGAPSKATDASNAQVALSAPSIAVDPGDADTVYVAYTLDAGVIAKATDAMTPMSGETLVLAVSTDGAKTFTNYVLESRPSGWEQWGEVASPAPGTVVVEAPVVESTAGLSVFVDASKGAGFAQPSSKDTSRYVAQGLHPDAPTVNGVPFNTIGSNGGTAGPESPRLFTDGAGHLCVTYVARYDPTSGDHKTRIAVQCSQNKGVTFGNVIDLEYDDGGRELHHPIGAMGPNGQVAVAWWTYLNAVSEIHVALSKDGGATFGAPSKVPTYAPANPPATLKPEYPAIAYDGGTLWLAYLVSDSLGPRRLVADKSCDGGVTWTGAVLLNGPEPTITDDYQWPALAIADGKPAVLARKGSEGTGMLPQEWIRLVP